MSKQAPIEHIQIFVANVDLGVERQNILKENLTEYFDSLNKKDPQTQRALTFVINAENKPLPNVLVANKDADVVFSGFLFDRVTGKKKKKALIIDDSKGGVLDIDPALRYPAVIELKKFYERGAFRQRRLFLVGDLRRKLRELIKTGMEIFVSFYEDEKRVESGDPIKLEKVEQLPREGDSPMGDQIDISNIDMVSIAGVTFHGVVNMPEVDNRFRVIDKSMVDTVRKIFALESLKDMVAKEALEGEKRVFVRRKKVMLVLNPDLKRVVADRLHFDKMERVSEFATVEEAIENLSTGKAQGIVEYLETEGYEILNTALDQEERDTILVACLGRQFHSYLQQEMKTQGGYLNLLSDDLVSEIFNGLPEEFMNTLLSGLQGKSYDKFLSLVPGDIREAVILSFLMKKKSALSGWKGIDKIERKSILKNLVHDVLATLQLTNTPSFQLKFPNVKFEYDKKYNSTTHFPKLKQDKIDLHFELFKNELQKKKFAANIWGTKFTQEEFDDLMSIHISMHPEQFYNILSPVVRKQLWTVVGMEYRSEINNKLHYLDKVKILEGNKEDVLKLLKVHSKEFLVYLKDGKEKTHDLASQLFLGLKRFNKVVSKTALLKKIVNDPKMKASRMEGLNQVLSSPRGKRVYDKLTEQIDALAAGYDSLICLSKDWEELKGFEELQKASLIFVDKEVDSALLEMFEQGNVDVDDYEKYAAEIEKKLNDLRQQLIEKEKEDPVGAYLLESMMVLMDMSVRAVRNELNAGMIEKLDERERIKKSVINNVEKNLVTIKRRLEVSSAEVESLGEQLGSEKERLGKYTEQLGKNKEVLQSCVEVYEETQQKMKVALNNKRKVALVQRNLSIEFFKLVRPLILEKVYTLPVIVEAAIRLIRNKFFPPAALKKRIIFKFSDEEIYKISKRNIVFVSNDEMLQRFIVTCLDIDHLNNTLFSIRGESSIPKDPDIIFIGPDVLEVDFSNIIKEKYTVPFADKKFFDALMKNENNKKQTKVAIKKYTVESRKQKGTAEKQGKAVKGMERNHKLITNRFHEMEKSRVGLEASIKRDNETQDFLRSEKETLTEKFQAIDEKFTEVKGQLKNLTEGGDSTLDKLQEGSGEMAQKLSQNLMEISQEMANMMFIKNVKEAGSKISEKTQQSIIEKIDKVSQFTGGAKAIKEIVIGDDGTNASMTLRKVINRALMTHFGVRNDQIIELKINRLEHNMVEGGQRYSFVVIVGDDQTEKMSNFKRMIKEIRRSSPSSYIILFASFGDLERKSEEFRENVYAIRDYCMLVNTELVDYSSLSRVLKLFSQVAPV